VVITIRGDILVWVRSRARPVPRSVYEYVEGSRARTGSATSIGVHGGRNVDGTMDHYANRITPGTPRVPAAPGDSPRDRGAAPRARGVGGPTTPTRRGGGARDRRRFAPSRRASRNLGARARAAVLERVTIAFTVDVFKFMTLSEPATGATAPTLGDAVAGPAALTVAERLKTLALNTYDTSESRPRPGSTRAPPLLHNLQRLHVHDCTRPRQLSTRIHSRTHFSGSPVVSTSLTRASAQ
jgi:hypothetical protein